MTCDHCGAPIKDVGAFCNHCGTRIVRPENTPSALRSATDPARYDLALTSPGYQLATKHRPAPPYMLGILGPAFLAVFAVGFLIVSQTAIRRGPGPDPFGGGFGILFAIVPLVMIAAAGGAAIKGILFARAPVHQFVYVVVDERVEVSGGGKNSSASTDYYATMQARDGSRIEYKTYGWLAGRIAPGDIGVAFTKRGMLIDFLRLEA